MPQRKMARVLMWVVSSSLADFLFALSNVVLIAGAAAVLVGTIGSIKMGAVREQFANERISANEAATSAANARAAEANAHAAELELKVAEARKLAGPRNIRDEDRVQMVRVLSQFRGTPYDLTLPPISDRGPLPELLEPGSFMVDHLIVVLSTMCGWQLRSVEGNVSKATLPAPLVLQSLEPLPPMPDGQNFAFNASRSIGQIAGIVGLKILLPLKDGGLTDASVALVKALNSVGITTEFDLPAPYNNVPVGALTGDAVHIVVGTKP